MQQQGSVTQDSSRVLALKKCAAGGLSSMTISSLLNPIDLIKTRLQTQSASDAKLGIVKCARQILRNEGGLFALWKVGLAVTASRSLCYSGLRLGLYEPVRDVISQVVLTSGNKDAGVTIKFISGFATGMLGSALVNPLDVIKIRLQSTQSALPGSKHTIISTFTDIVKNEGVINGLYKGVSVTCIRAAFLTAAQMSSYDHSKYLLTTYAPSVFDREHFSTHITCALIASIVTTITYAPLDTVKTRYMNDRSSSKEFNGVVDCFVKIAKNEGVPGLYRGAFANFLRLGPHFILSFPLYEGLRKFFGVPAM